MSTSNTSDLATLLKSLLDVRRQKATLEETEKVIMAELKPVVDPMFNELPDAPVVGDGLILTRISGTHRVINADKLLERGVAADIVNYATKSTTYFQYRVKEAK